MFCNLIGVWKFLNRDKPDVHDSQTLSRRGWRVRLHSGIVEPHNASILPPVLFCVNWVKVVMYVRITTPIYVERGQKTLQTYMVLCTNICENFKVP